MPKRPHDPEPDPEGFPQGELRSPDGVQVEQRVRVATGKGSWAYWVTDPAVTFNVVADTIFNRHAPHFAGKLRHPHPGRGPAYAWLVVHGWVEPPRERHLYIEDEDEGLPRMERRLPDGDITKP